MKVYQNFQKCINFISEIENTENTHSELLQQARDILSKKEVQYPTLPDIAFPKGKLHNALLT